MWHLQTGSCGLGFGVLCGVGVWWLQGCVREREREREKEEIVTVGVRCV